MWDQFQQSLDRYHDLERQMGDGTGGPSKLAQLAKEHGKLAKQVQPYVDFRKVEAELADAKALHDAEADPEMKALAAEEVTTLDARRATLQERLEELMLVEGEDFDSIIVEIRAGTGGDEAALFAGDLYRMYTRYAEDQGWKCEDIAFSPGEKGGYKEVQFSVTGDEVYQHLRYESGGHRVQRVPETETQGRIHTSAATVAILAEPDAVQVEIHDDDIEWERMRAGGAGGQHVNKTESAVRIWYKRGTPDEMEVKCQDERSQGKNYEQAMRVLRGRVYDRQQAKQHAQRAELRKSLIGSGDRSERIRTYNFPQNRLTDHRINLNLYKLDAIVAGALGDLVRALREFDKNQRLGRS